MSDPSIGPPQLQSEVPAPPFRPTNQERETEEHPANQEKETEEEKPEAGLHFRSAPGAGLVLAGILVLVGVGVATAGYWPPRTPRQTPPRPRERLKLIGPIILAVGLFILICSSTLLYENRDRQRLRDHGGKRKRKKRRRRRKRKPPGNDDAEPSEQATPCLPPDDATHTLTDSELNIHCVTEPPVLLLNGRQDSPAHTPGLCRATLTCDRPLPPLTPPIIKLNNRIIDPVPYPLEPPPLPQRTYKLKKAESGSTDQ